MTTSEIQKLSRDLDILHEKHKYHPAVILIQSTKDRAIFVLMVGSPSREWLCHVLDDVLYRAAGEAFLTPNIPAGVMKGGN
jgi:hypothetical protein